MGCGAVGSARGAGRLAVVGRFRGVRECTVRATLTDPPESGSGPWESRAVVGKKRHQGNPDALRTVRHVIDAPRACQGVIATPAHPGAEDPSLLSIESRVLRPASDGYTLPCSSFVRTLRLGLALAAVALASSCGTAQSALPFVSPDAPLRYSTYFNPQGELRGEAWALALMGHPAHREQVFLQAQQGLFPASEAWLSLEAVYQEGYDARWALLQRKSHAQAEPWRRACWSWRRSPLAPAKPSPHRICATEGWLPSPGPRSCPLKTLSAGTSSKPTASAASTRCVPRGPAARAPFPGSLPCAGRTTASSATTFRVAMSSRPRWVAPCFRSWSSPPALTGCSQAPANRCSPATWARRSVARRGCATRTTSRWTKPPYGKAACLAWNPSASRSAPFRR
jgi:hypothetical protein